MRRLIPGVTLMLAASAFAADETDCSNAPTQMAMNECVGKSLKASDQKLNATYKALLAKVSKDGGEQLKKTQRVARVARHAMRIRDDEHARRQHSPDGAGDVHRSADEGADRASMRNCTARKAIRPAAGSKARLLDVVFDEALLPRKADEPHARLSGDGDGK